MNLTAFITLLLIITAGSSCSKKVSLTPDVSPFSLEALEMPLDSMPPTSNPRCHVEGPVVMRLRDAEGYIEHRPSVGLWYISYVEPLPPGAVTDSKYSGFVCNMPDAYKHKGLKVRFSGQYYHAWKHIPKAHAGETPLYLFLTYIRNG